MYIKDMWLYYYLNTIYFHTRRGIYYNTRPLEAHYILTNNIDYVNDTIHISQMCNPWKIIILQSTIEKWRVYSNVRY